MSPRARYGYIHECWQKDGERCQQRPWHAAHQITDEGSGGKDRTRRDLTDRDGIEQLPIRQPMQIHHEIGMQKGQQHIAAAKENSTDLQEGEEQRQLTKARNAGCCS